MAESTITEAAGTDSRLELIQKLLNKAESTDSAPEAEALTDRAAALMAKYGIDRAMLAEAGKEADPIVDTVVFAQRPYAKPMQELLYSIAIPLGAEVRTIKQWDPNDHGGRTKGAWQFGVRLFVHSSDLLRIQMMYSSLRNQAISGASKIRGYETYGQDQRAFRINYLNGFSTAIWTRLEQQEQAAKQAREAEEQELADKALLSGESVGRSVALVLADRQALVKNTANLALYGRTTAEIEASSAASRERWAEADRKAQDRRDAHRAEHESCERCAEAKSGYCARHRDLKPRSYRPSYESVGSSYYYDGHADGRRADLGVRPGTQLGNSRKALD